MKSMNYSSIDKTIRTHYKDFKIKDWTKPFRTTNDRCPDRVVFNFCEKCKMGHLIFVQIDGNLPCTECKSPCSFIEEFGLNNEDFNYEAEMSDDKFDEEIGRPLARMLLKEQGIKTCIFCYNVDNQFKKMYCNGKCNNEDGIKSAIYCNKFCQKGDWKRHKEECGVIDTKEEEAKRNFNFKVDSEGVISQKQ